MRIESAFYSSREGLQAHGQAISVVGDNISNANTVGFKGSRIEFANLLEVGSGVQVQRVRQDSESGVVEQTGRSLDAAIEGGGYFVVGDTDQQYYSRAGNFSISADGNLVDSSGKSVLGFKDGSTTLSEINLFSLPTAGTPTANAAVTGNISSQKTVVAGAPANPASFEALADASSFTGTMTVFDSLGQSHDIMLAFTKTAATAGGGSTWVAQAYIDGGEVGGTEGTPVQLGANATLAFDGSGLITEASQANAVITANPAYGNGATTGAITINLAQMTQFATGSQLSGITQDGKGAGGVKDFRFDSDGSLYAIRDSGTETLVARLPIATFRNVDGLDRVGANLFTATEAAGTRVLGTAGEGNSGSLEGGALERSTVDLASQFVDLVLYQRGYQASSQTLSAANDLLKSTLGLIR